MGTTKKRTEEQIQESDPYGALIHLHWDEISGIYDSLEDKTPVLLFTVPSKKILAYHFDDFAEDLSEQDKSRIAKDRKAVLSGRLMLVFVRDDDQRRLISYSFKR